MFAPDGSHIYFTVSGETHPQPTLVRMPVLGGVMTELISNVHSPVAFSPDGEQLAFVRRDDAGRRTSIVLASAADGHILRTLVTRTLPQTLSSVGLAWSPDGRTVAVGNKTTDGQEQISAVSVADSSVAPLGARAWGVTGNLAWLPDGSGVVLLARENLATRKAQIWFAPFPTGEAKRVTNDLNFYQANSLSMSADGTLAVLHGFIQSAIWTAPRGDSKRAHRVLQGVAPRYEGVDGLAWTVDRRLLYTAYTGDNALDLVDEQRRRRPPSPDGQRRRHRGPSNLHHGGRPLHRVPVQPIEHAGNLAREHGRYRADAADGRWRPFAAHRVARQPLGRLHLDP